VLCLSDLVTLRICNLI